MVLLNIDISRIGEQTMTHATPRAFAPFLALGLAAMLWSQTAAPMNHVVRPAATTPVLM